MSYTFKGLDDACADLARVAKRDGLSRVTIDIGVDGRVSIYAARGFNTAWSVQADTLPGGALEFPSAAVCSALNAFGSSAQPPPRCSFCTATEYCSKRCEAAYAASVKRGNAK